MMSEETMFQVMDRIKFTGSDPCQILMSPSMKYALDMEVQGKRLYCGKAHKRKSPMRQSYKVRMRRSKMKVYTHPLSGFDAFFSAMWAPKEQANG